MRTSARLGAAALAAALLLAAACTTASAGRLSVSTQNIRVTWREIAFVTAAATIRCEVTLEGTLTSRSFTKTARTLIGAVTRAEANEAGCVNGRLSPFETPWHLTYESFTGTLPSIRTVELLLARFRFRAIIPGVCPAGAEYGAAADNITLKLFRETDTSISSVDTVTGRNVATKIAGGALCPAEGRLVATLGLLTVLNAATHVSVTLI